MKKEKQKKYEPVKVLDMENRLIAEFMGMEESNGEYYRRIYNSGDWIPVNDLEFKTSWDWLMPVVVECFERFGETDTIDYMRLNDALLEVNKKSLYKAVVKCINEYNYRKKDWQVN